MRLTLAALAFAALLPTAGFAQDAPTPQAAGAGQITDTKQVGDWTVRCFAIQNESPCDMFQELQDQNTHQRVLSFSIAYVPSQDKHVVQIAVPLGVSLAKGAVIKTDAYGSPPLPFRRCDQMGCYVEMLFNNDQIGDLAKSGPQASVNVEGDGKAFPLRFSLNGFSGAHDAMVALAKQKAVTPGSAPAAPAPAKKK